MGICAGQGVEEDNTDRSRRSKRMSVEIRNPKRGSTAFSRRIEDIKK